jgi:hypothetical protein
MQNGERSGVVVERLRYGHVRATISVEKSRKRWKNVDINSTFNRCSFVVVALLSFQDVTICVVDGKYEGQK